MLIDSVAGLNPRLTNNGGKDATCQKCENAKSADLNGLKSSIGGQLPLTPLVKCLG